VGGATARRTGSGRREWAGHPSARATAGGARDRPRGREPLARRDAGGAAVRPALAGRSYQEEPPVLTVPNRGAAGGGARHAAQVATGIFLTRVLGYVRERVFAYYFGNDSVPADAFRAALRIPNGIRNLLGEGPLLGSFIPVYAALNERADKSAARAVAGATLGLLFLAAGGLALLVTTFALV